MSKDIYGQCVHGFNLASCDKCMEVRRSDSRIKNNGWTPVIDQMPEDRISVLVYIDETDEIAVCHYDETVKEWLLSHNYLRVGGVTHWKELDITPND